MTFKEYLIDAVGEIQAELILNNPDATFVIKEDGIPATGKSLLSDILWDKGYSIIEERKLKNQKIIELSMRRKESIPKEEWLGFMDMIEKINDGGLDIT